MRLTNYGMLTNREEPNENELALEYIRKTKKIVMIIRDILLIALSFLAGVIFTFNYLDNKGKGENE